MRWHAMGCTGGKDGCEKLNQHMVVVETSAKESGQLRRVCDVRVRSYRSSRSGGRNRCWAGYAGTDRRAVAAAAPGRHCSAAAAAAAAAERWWVLGVGRVRCRQGGLRGRRRGQVPRPPGIIIAEEEII